MQFIPMKCPEEANPQREGILIDSWLQGLGRGALGTDFSGVMQMFQN